MRRISALIILLVFLAFVPVGNVPSVGAVQSDLSGYTICVDAGHGGTDPGAVANGVQEKDINLAIALKVAKLLEEDGAKVVLTRDGDYFVTLSGRVQIANSAGCDIFISIHANAGPSSASGFEVYHYYGSTRGNLLATYVDEEIAKEIPLKNRGVKEAGFYVIKYTKMPAILIETGFVTNTYDVSIITDENYQWKYAYAILHGVQRYFGVPVHDPVPTVTGIRFAQHDGYFRVVLDLSKSVSYHVYYTSYSYGYHLVIQLDGAKLADLGWNTYNGWQYIYTGSPSVPYIYATESNGYVFIVLVLNTPYLPYNSFTLSNPDRIVVDVYS
ncbi:N-acetylmuramoyl-L-alanine amidase [Thermococcus sp. AM4]|uniref:N-acetylmuramoyl-L-alanine amidase n=1 Tax=Thermococcus sp. (strain AM4) TaxID=246969 RepID=UPI00018708D4|nr:N-acetylmuramoyl-L-alanine amidase [Thermococcus sp. AM4]EEB73171.1 N-acetylmuramoyl-L-alanine amidase [Thermococcus sp. AM4]